MDFLPQEGYLLFDYHVHSSNLQPLDARFRATLSEFTDLPSASLHSGYLYPQLANAESFHNLFVRDARCVFYDILKTYAYENPDFSGYHLQLLHGQMVFKPEAGVVNTAQPMTHVPSVLGESTLQVTLNCAKSEPVNLMVRNQRVEIPPGYFMVYEPSETDFVVGRINHSFAVGATPPPVQLLHFGVHLSSSPDLHAFIPEVESRMINGAPMLTPSGDLPLMYPIEFAQDRIYHTIARTFPPSFIKPDGGLKIFSPSMEIPPAYTIGELQMYNPHYIHQDDLRKTEIEDALIVFAGEPSPSPLREVAKRSCADFLSPSPIRRRGPIIDPSTGKCF